MNVKLYRAICSEFGLCEEVWESVTKKDKIPARLRHGFKDLFIKVVLLINMFQAFPTGGNVWLRTRLQGVWFYFTPLHIFVTYLRKTTLLMTDCW